MYLKIKNSGLIESGALSLIGASDKRGSEKIGQFGSGNKYALAYMLRNNWNFRVFSGTREVEVTTKEEKFRDHSFNVIYIDGEKTSITTEMGGVDWEPWSVVREIYSNAIDEGGEGIEEVSSISPEEGKTHFYIGRNKDIVNILSDFDKYFRVSRKRVLAETSYGAVLSKAYTEPCVYRKGIRCSNLLGSSVFDYDFTKVPINESRVVTSGWTLCEHVWKIIFELGDKELIMTALKASVDSKNLEGQFNLVSLPMPSAQFTAAVSDEKFFPFQYAGFLDENERKKYTFIHELLYKRITGKSVEDAINFDPDAGAWRVITPSNYHRKVLNDALHFLKECDWRKIDYDIDVAIFSDNDILGIAKDERIILNETVLDEGVQKTVETIIEEFVHIKFQCHDKSRRMQDALIKELVTYMKKKNAYTL